jgi:hypothetical protein
MRTTITLDPDTLALLQREISRSHVSFKRAVNDAIRRGLSVSGPTKPSPAEVLPFHSGYQPGVDRLRLQQLADELETDDALARVSGRQ